jgi:hypothetical protein
VYALVVTDLINIDCVGACLEISSWSSLLEVIVEGLKMRICWISIQVLMVVGDRDSSFGFVHLFGHYGHYSNALQIMVISKTLIMIVSIYPVSAETLLISRIVCTFDVLRSRDIAHFRLESCPQAAAFNADIDVCIINAPDLSLEDRQTAVCSRCK